MKPFRIIIYLLLAAFLCCATAGADPLLIANPSVGDTSLKSSDVQLVFLGKKKKWENGDKIYVVTLKKGPLHEAFLKTHVNKTPSRFSSYWKIATVTGTGIPPKTFASEQELMTYVAGKKGAVGYISSSTIPDGVKTLSIE
jgi:hypothetical protein